MRGLIPPLLLLLSVTAFAQLHETMTVEVIDVPVYVTAADGTPIRNLSRSAFSLFVNGKPQPIDYFDAIDFAPRVAATPGRTPDLRERRLYLLLFDLAFSPPGLIARAQQASDVAVGRSDPATDYFAVATYTRRDGVKFVTPFSNDHVLVRRAIETLTAGDMRDPLGVALSPKRRDAWAKIEAQAQGKPLALSFGKGNEWSDDAEAIDKIRGGLANQEIARQPAKDDVNEQMTGLAALAASLATLEGQKHVVIFSVGFDPTLIADLGAGYGEDPQLRRYREEMANAFRRAGAFLDAINVVGQRREQQDESLRRMAEPTGGQLVRNTNDLSQALDRLTSSQQAVYQLGFRRGAATQGDIDVKVEGLPRGARVSFRTGFGKPERGAVNSLQLADIVTNDIPQNGLSAHVDIKPEKGVGADITVLFKPREVVARLVAEKPWLEVLLYVFDEHGGTALFESKRIPFDPQSPPTVSVAGVRERAKLPPGRYIAKALLHIAGTNSLGFVREAFVVE